MARMVDDLFELSRLQAGSFELSLEPVQLDEAISEALALSGPVARARGVRLGGYADPGVAVLADSRELSRMIGSLVANAIHHTPSEGAVEVVARSRGSTVELAVSDECGGIPESDLPRVFDVAWRGTHARTPGRMPGRDWAWRSSQESSRLIVARFGVDNVGGGCRFSVRLPV
jgi:signal transduction histidine kinase